MGSALGLYRRWACGLCWKSWTYRQRFAATVMLALDARWQVVRIFIFARQRCLEETIQGSQELHLGKPQFQFSGHLRADV